jgi:hypothetical protein
MNETNAVELSLVEDNTRDLEPGLRALREATIVNEIQIGRDGAEGLDCFSWGGRYAHRATQSS